MTTNLPTAVTPEGWHIGAGFAEFLHGVGHGDLDDEEGQPDDDESAVCIHGRDDYCRPCNVRARADERYLADGGRLGWQARDGQLGRLAE